MKRFFSRVICFIFVYQYSVNTCFATQTSGEVTDQRFSAYERNLKLNEEQARLSEERNKLLWIKKIEEDYEALDQTKIHQLLSDTDQWYRSFLAWARKGASGSLDSSECEKISSQGIALHRQIEEALVALKPLYNMTNRIEENLSSTAVSSENPSGAQIAALNSTISALEARLHSLLKFLDEDESKCRSFSESSRSI
jgi:hypothetical protein